MRRPTHSGIVNRGGSIPKVQVWLIRSKGHWLNAETRKIERPIRTPERIPFGSVEPGVTAGLALGSTIALQHKETT